jgi:hypothetical protein
MVVMLSVDTLKADACPCTKSHSGISSWGLTDGTGRAASLKAAVDEAAEVWAGAGCGAAVVTVQESSSAPVTAVGPNTRKRSMIEFCHTKPLPLEGRQVVERLACDARACPLSV